MLFHEHEETWIHHHAIIYNSLIHHRTTTRKSTYLYIVHKISILNTRREIKNKNSVEGVENLWDQIIIHCCNNSTCYSIRGFIDELLLSTHTSTSNCARKRVYVAILRHPNITARHQIWMYKFIFEWWFFVCNWLSTTSCSNIVMPKFIYPQMRISQYLVEIVNLSTLAY